MLLSNQHILISTIVVFSSDWISGKVAVLDCLLILILKGVLR